MGLRERERVRGYCPLLIAVLYTLDHPEVMERKVWEASMEWVRRQEQFEKAWVASGPEWAEGLERYGALIDQHDCGHGKGPMIEVGDVQL